MMRLIHDTCFAEKHEGAAQNSLMTGIQTRRPHECTNRTTADELSISKSEPKSSSKRIRSSKYKLTTGSFPEQPDKPISDKRYSEHSSAAVDSGKNFGPLFLHHCSSQAHMFKLFFSCHLI